MLNKFKEQLSGNCSSIVEPRDFVSGLRFPENINDYTLQNLIDRHTQLCVNLLGRNLGAFPVLKLDDVEAKYRQVDDRLPHDTWEVMNTGSGLTFKKYNGKIGLGSVQVAFIYDKNGRIIKDYDARGDITQHYEYDHQGFLKRVSRDVSYGNYGNTDKYVYAEGVLSSIESQMWSRDGDKRLPYKWGEAFTINKE